MTNNNKEDYNAELLKSMIDLKKRIDELVNKNHEEINILEITHIRNRIDRMHKKYGSKCDTNSTMKKSVRNSDCEKYVIKSSVNNEMKELIDVTSNFCSELDTLKSHLKQNINDNKKRTKVTNEDDTNKCQNDDCDTIVHEECNRQLRLHEEYTKELECRFRKFLNTVLVEQRSDNKRMLKDIGRQSSILKYKRNESHYKNEVIRLTKELDYARKRCEDRQRQMDGAIMKIEQLKRDAEINATSLLELSKSLSSIAIFLSLFRGDRCLKADAVECEVVDSSESNESNNDEKDTTSLSRGQSIADVFRNFFRPVSHSTPKREHSHKRDEDIKCSFSKPYGQQKKDDKNNGHPSPHANNTTKKQTFQSLRLNNTTEKQKIVEPPPQRPSSKDCLVCKCRNGSAETDRSGSLSPNEKIDMIESCDMVRSIICICHDRRETIMSTKRF